VSDTAPEHNSARLQWKAKKTLHRA